MICIDNIRGARDMGDTSAQVLVWEMTVFEQPGSSGKAGRGCTHVGSITNVMCCSKTNGIGGNLTLVGENRGA